MTPQRKSLLLAPDSFKGTLAAPAVAAALARGVRANGRFEADEAPVADGGEGTLDVLLAALGGEIVAAPASDPLGRPLEARFALLGGGERALLEVAAASGLTLVAEAERDAERATSAGTGALILAAVEAGAREVIVAAGGSASTDGGAGALAVIAEGGGLHGARLTVLCDVRTRFELAAAHFAAQKGADAASVQRLSRRLEAFAQTLPRDPRGLPMTGAAGGLAGGLWAAHSATLIGGAAFVLNAISFEARMRRAHAVIVGEGRLDAGTLEGKIAGEIATRARQAGVPAHAIVGGAALDDFGLRILDLQIVLEAGDVASLELAASALAAMI